MNESMRAVIRNETEEENEDERKVVMRVVRETEMMGTMDETG